MIRDELSPCERCPPMNDLALRSRKILDPNMFEAPAHDVLPLRWSVPIWLFLAAASWTAVYFVASLFF